MNVSTRMKNSLLMILFVTTCLLLFRCTVPATLQKKGQVSTFQTTPSLLDDIIERGVLKVGTTGDFMPFSYHLDADVGTYYGVDIELAKDLAQSLEVDVEFVPATWSSMMPDIKAGKFDIGMSGITIKLSRQREALFSLPLLSSGKAAITRDENVTIYTSIEAINQTGVKVIVNPGGTNEAFARANFPNATIIQNEDNLSIFERIVDGTADVMVTDAVETLIQELIHPELEAVNPTEPFNFFEMGYLLPRDHTLKAYVDQWLNLKQKDGSYQEIFDRELNRIKERAIADGQ